MPALQDLGGTLRAVLAGSPDIKGRFDTIETEVVTLDIMDQPD